MAALEKLSIDTPEQVALEYSLATVGSRFLALAIDTVVQAGVAAGLLALMVALRLLTGPFGRGNVPWLMAIVVLGWFIVYYGYYAIFEAMWNGQTPGKRVVGIRVMHSSGRPLSVYEAILRNVVRIVDQIPLIYAVGLVSVFATERSQRLGDLAASTVVVHERVTRGGVDQFDVPTATTHHGAARLTDEEISVVEMFLRRRHELDGYARINSAARIARRVRQRLDLKATTEDERLLEEIAAEFRARRNY